MSPSVRCGTGISGYKIAPLSFALAMSSQSKSSEQLSIAAAAVDLLGSDKVRLRALDLRDAHNKVYDAYVKITSEWVKNPGNQALRS
jgi:hypothetical protein